MTPAVTAPRAASRSMRVVIRRASVDILAELKTEHSEACTTASSSSIRVCGEDMVLMHHSPGHQHADEWEDRPSQAAAEQYDASVLATTIMLFGPGMQLPANLLAYLPS
jgi:hypothetical protein